MSSPPAVTLEEARRQLAAWVAALSAARAGTSYSLGGRSLTAQDVETCETEVTRWHRRVLALEAYERGTVRPLGAQAGFPSPGAGGGGGLISDEQWQGG